MKLTPPPDAPVNIEMSQKELVLVEAILAEAIDNGKMGDMQLILAEDMLTAIQRYMDRLNGR